MSSSESTTASIPSSLHEYLANCTPEELNAILDAVHALCKKHQKLDMPLGHHKVKKTKRAATKTAAKRPLNSWMAFRTYYSPIFGSQQQKDISSLMTRLWKVDPFHAKWTILAKAYSIIRDYKAMPQPELDAFLEICCPHIGIIHPGNYLQKLGWEFKSIDNANILTRDFVPQATDFEDNLKANTISVEDLISFCCDVGHVNTDNMEILGGRPSLTMATPIAKSTNMAAGNSQVFNFGLPTPDPSNASLSNYPTPSMSPSTGNVVPSNTVNAGTGMGQTGVSNSHYLTANQYKVNDSADSFGASSLSTNSELAHGPFAGYMPYEYPTADATENTALNDMYYDKSVPITGFGDTNIFDPLGKEKFIAFTISRYDDSDIFDEDLLINYNFGASNHYSNGTNNAH